MNSRTSKEGMTQSIPVAWELAKIEDRFRNSIIKNMDIALHPNKKELWMLGYERGHFLRNAGIRIDHFKTAQSLKKRLPEAQDEAEHILNLDKTRIAQDLTGLLKENIPSIDNPTGSYGINTYGTGSQVYLKSRGTFGLAPTGSGLTDKLSWSTDLDTGEKIFKSRRLENIEPGMYDVIDLVWGDMDTEPYLHTAFMFDGEETPGGLPKKNELRERRELLSVQADWEHHFSIELSDSVAE
jgi:hypothetical protein